MEHQKEKKRQSKSNSSLPQDLMVEILLRLPEKSVGRFRSVSKLWLSITTDPYFINLFGNRSHRPSLLLCFKEDDKLFVSSILQHNQDMNDSYSCFKKFQECSLLPHTESVHGLICFQKSATPIIWNSSTQQYLYLPKPNIGWEYLTVLLGYDPVEGKHKLVCMPFQQSCDVCHVLTLGSVRESWRTVKNNHNHRSHYHTTGRCIKGVVYYLAYVHSTRVIMSFDVRLEKFDMIQLPSDHIHENVVTTYKGRLACVENFTTKDGRIICKDGKMVWEDSITLWILEDPEQHKWSSKDILAPFGQCDESLNAYFKDRGINVAGVFLYKSSSFPDLDYIIHFNRVKNTFEKIRVIRRRADGKARLYNKVKNRRMNQRFLHPSVIDPKAKEGQDANIEMALSDEVKIETKGRDQTAAQAPTRTSSGSKKYVTT